MLGTGLDDKFMLALSSKSFQSSGAGYSGETSKFIIGMCYKDNTMEANEIQRWCSNHERNLERQKGHDIEESPLKQW